MSIHHIELLLHTKEIDHLHDLVRRSTDVTEEAAKRLRIHPAEAARLWRALGMRIVKETRSKSYPGAVRNFERARRCYERAGIAADWPVTGKSITGSLGSCRGSRRS